MKHKSSKSLSLPQLIKIPSNENIKLETLNSPDSSLAAAPQFENSGGEIRLVSRSVN